MTSQGDAKCPCGSGSAQDDCCGPIVAGAPAPTAEALLRARYTAFALGDVGFIERTLAPEASEDFDPVEAGNTAQDATWQGLEIRAVAEGGEADDAGVVEFVARFRLNGTQQVHHERARFRRVDGEWRCAGGEINPKSPPRRVEKIGRNAPCPCGSGKKYKKCCGA